MKLYNSTVTVGVNDFQTLFPELAAQWSSKNLFAASDVVPGSDRKCLWVCEQGHEWETRVRVRAKMKSGCPECFRVSKRKIIPKSTLVFWDESENNILVDAVEGLPRSRKCYWKCQEGHKWEASLSNQIKRKNPCLVCIKGESVVKAITHPKNSSVSKNIAEWFLDGTQTSWFFDEERNNFPADTLSVGSNKKIWWICSGGKHSRLSSPSELLKSERSLRCNQCYLQENNFVRHYPHLLDEWDYEKNIANLESLTSGSAQTVYWVCSYGHKWNTPLYSRTGKNPSQCPSCTAVRTVSRKERSLSSWLRTVLQDGRTSVRNVITGVELDFYSPSYKIAVEFNGLFWHDANHKSYTYHLDKFVACQNAGIQLYQVWEDDWDYNSPAVKTALLQKFNMSSKKIYADETVFVEVSALNATIFLNNCDVQGDVTSGLFLGLEFNGNLVALAIFDKQPEKQEIDFTQYVTSMYIEDGFKKLLEGMISFYSDGFSRVIAYSDNMMSDDILFRSNDFEITTHLPPDYKYVVAKHRVDKAGYCVNRFQNDPELKFKKGLTVIELADLNKINRVYDAGKTKWVKNIA